MKVIQCIIVLSIGGIAFKDSTSNIPFRNYIIMSLVLCYLIAIIVEHVVASRKTLVERFSEIVSDALTRYVLSTKQPQLQRLREEVDEAISRLRTGLFAPTGVSGIDDSRVTLDSLKASLDRRRAGGQT